MCFYLRPGHWSRLIFDHKPGLDPGSSLLEAGSKSLLAGIVRLRIDQAG
jgi:hypothetical protein